MIEINIREISTSELESFFNLTSKLIDKQLVTLRSNRSDLSEKDTRDFEELNKVYEMINNEIRRRVESLVDIEVKTKKRLDEKTIK